LGIKQLSSDPWEHVPEKYRPGTRVTGTVTNITDFGVFVELEEGIEGLIHVSELSKDKGSNPLSRFKMDDVIQAKVINVSGHDKKIGLSVRKLEESEEKEIYQSYLNDHKEATSNLGELLKEGMMNLQRESPADDQKPEESPPEKQDESDSSDSASVEEETEKTETV
jgi:small subunit ribosomal protein S1